MEALTSALDFVLHLDVSLLGLVRDYGAWTYAVLFLVVFCETGLVVTPFLPGDSLLFAAGALAAAGSLDVSLVIVLLAVAAILGDAVNYSLGSTVAARWILGKGLVRPEHIERAEGFYRRHGGKAIVLARFAPFLRTFVPFVAGIARMSYHRFAAFNVLGAIAWVASCSLAGYVFANIPVVKENFTAFVLGIVAVSLLPAVIAVFRRDAPGVPRWTS